MVDLSSVSAEDLARELERRGATPACKCRKWQTYMGAYDVDGYTLRCHGCLRAVERCTCG